jgi:glutamine---fructose-6-phosphate transaminase (isomerizing)
VDIYLNDVLNQPVAMQQAFERYFSDEYLYKIDCVASLIKDKNTLIYFTGMGSSYYSSFGAEMLLNNSGFRAFSLSASEFLHFKTQAIRKDDIIVLVSQSGRSAEVTRLTEMLARSGFTNLFLVTNHESCHIGRYVRAILPMYLEEEAFISTRTYLASIMINLILASRITGADMKDLKSSFCTILDIIRNYLDAYVENQKQLASFFGDVRHIEFLGRGPGYGSALVSALCVKEYTKIPNEAMDLGDFMHGSFEITGKDFKAFLFVHEGPTYGITIEVAKKMLRNGTKIALVTDHPPGFTHENLLTICMPCANEHLSQIGDFIPHQLLNQALAERLQVRKDGWLYGKKVTDQE